MKREKILKIKTLLIMGVFISFSLVSSILWPSSIRGSCRINDLSLEKEGNFIKLTIYGDEPFEFVHSTPETKEGQPYRVIIDCKDAIHSLPQHNFRSDLPFSTIKAIRTSQFQTEPEKIVRIVLDLDQPVIYKVVATGEGKKGVIALSTAPETSFPFWSAVKNEKSPSESKLSSPNLIEKTAKETSEAKDNLLASSENKTRFDLETSRNAKEQEAEKEASFKKPLSFADTSDINTKREASQVSIAKPKIEKAEVEPIGEDLKTKKNVSEQTGEKSESGSIGMVLATLTSPELFSVPKPETGKLPSEQVKDKKTETNIAMEASKGSSVKSSSPASFKIEEKESSSENQRLSLVQESERSKTKETLPGYSIKEENAQKELPSHPESPSSQKEVISATAEGEKTLRKPAEKSETESMNPTEDQEKVTPLSSKKDSTNGGATLSESLLVLSKPEGTELELAPKRRVIYYHEEGRRDPFAPLTERITTDFGKIPLPTFESLKLVGILKDEEGNRALLEDEKGYGYILKNGDKIKNGYVVSVEDNKVIFQITEYGWSKAITLELSTEH